MNLSYLVTRFQSGLIYRELTQDQGARVQQSGTAPWSSRVTLMEQSARRHRPVLRYTRPCLHANPSEALSNLALLDSVFSSRLFIHYILLCFRYSSFSELFLHKQNMNCHTSELIMQPGMAFSNRLKVYSAAETQCKCHLFHKIVTGPPPTQMPPHSVFPQHRVHNP